jgi:hypothetical protein
MHQRGSPGLREPQILPALQKPLLRYPACNIRVRSSHNKPNLFNVGKWHLGGGLVTGEILAVYPLPIFSPEQYATSRQYPAFNRNVTGWHL